MGLKDSPKEQLFFFFFSYKWRALENCTVPFDGIFSQVFPYSLDFLQSLTKRRPFFRFMPLPIVEWTRGLCPGDNRRLFSISRTFINFYHFRVTLNLITKASLSAKFLLYKISFQFIGATASLGFLLPYFHSFLFSFSRKRLLLRWIVGVVKGIRSSLEELRESRCYFSVFGY